MKHHLTYNFLKIIISLKKHFFNNYIYRNKPLKITKNWNYSSRKYDDLNKGKHGLSVVLLFVKWLAPGTCQLCAFLTETMQNNINLTKIIRKRRPSKFAQGKQTWHFFQLKDRNETHTFPIIYLQKHPAFPILHLQWLISRSYTVRNTCSLNPITSWTPALPTLNLKEHLLFRSYTIKNACPLDPITSRTHTLPLIP